MAKNKHLHPADLHAAARLAADATHGITDLVEAVHHAIAHPPGTPNRPPAGRTSGITGLVYRSVRGVTKVVGGGLDVLLAQLAPPPDAHELSPEREAVLSAVNGVWGDYLLANHNHLAVTMTVRVNGRSLPHQPAALHAALPEAGGKLLLLIHGLCMNDQQWTRHDHDHGAALARDLGYTPLYLRYNTGRHVSVNGRDLADLLQTLLPIWPQPITELTIIGHSMGGLVARSAIHHATAAGYDWPRHLRHLICLGTPHHGAPLERGGNGLEAILGATPYTAPFARLGQQRSAGITDLRYGNLLDEDWAGQDRFTRTTDQRQIVPLPPGVQSYAIAATTGAQLGALKDRLIGDGLVPLDSALGRHPDPARTLDFPLDHQWIGYEMNHLDLLSHPDVYTQIRHWLT